MLIPLGRHKGETTEMILFLDPLYVRLILQYSNPEGLMPEVRKDFLRLITIFDSKKMPHKCPRCGNGDLTLAHTKGSLYYQFWCPDCRPNLREDMAEKVEIFSDYKSALDYASRYFQSSIHYRMIIRNLAVLKGLRENFTAEDAARFLSRGRGRMLNAEC